MLILYIVIIILVILLLLTSMHLILLKKEIKNIDRQFVKIMNESTNALIKQIDWLEKARNLMMY